MDMNLKYQTESKRYNRALMERRYDDACASLSALASIREQENCLDDSIKLSCIQFWLRIVGARGFGCDGESARRIKRLTENVGMSIYELRELFLQTCLDDNAPTARMTARDCLYLLEVCMDGRYDDADEIFKRVVQKKPPI